MEEVSAPGPEGAQDIINRWKPFNPGESLVAHMEQLYPTLLRSVGMPISVGTIASIP